jgi:uncharacterized protein
MLQARLHDMMRPVVAFFAGLFLFVAATVAGSAQEHPMLLPVDPAPLLVETATGEQRFSIEIADDGIERARGLMFRRTMPDYRGMLFIFEQTQRVSFWMKNTPMPLDLLFIGEDGVVKAILQGIPYSEAPIGPATPVRFDLELTAGTAQKAGIAEGDRMRHPRIDEIAGAN